MPLFVLEEYETVAREIITSRKNPLLQHVKKLLQSRSYRQEQGQFAADGTKLLEEAVKWIPHLLQTVLVTERAEICPLPEHVKLVQIPDDVMAQISPMETPQGALFVCRLPSFEAAPVMSGSLVLDGIQDPGNLGTILRTADALDAQVVLTPGCADAYNPKTVRAAMGALFRRLPQWLSHEQVLQLCRESGTKLYVTALSDRAKDLRSVSLKESAVVIGSEGRGAGEYFLSNADGELIIPMNERCESLNAAVAAAIVLWEMKR